jgi:hypothetical protein
VNRYLEARGQSPIGYDELNRAWDRWRRKSQR